MSNPHNFAVDYEWEPSDPTFAITPAAGSIEPKRTVEVTVRWKPAVGAASGTATAPSAQQDATAAAAAKGGKAAAGKLASGKGAAGKGAATAGSSPAAIASASNASSSSAAAAAAPQPPTSLVQAASMTLRLERGADVPQRVALVGELPGGQLRLKEKEVTLGPVPVGELQTVVLVLRNTGTGKAAFRVRLCLCLCGCGCVYVCCERWGGEGACWGLSRLGAIELRDGAAPQRQAVGWRQGV